MQREWALRVAVEKKKAHAGLDKGKEKETIPIQRKRVGLTPLVELEQNMQEAKQKKEVS